jgi:hypothetical protein
VGIVYNLHHGHDHIDNFLPLFKRIQPWLFCVNINGMDRMGDKQNRKILQLGQGEKDLELLNMILKSGYKGPIGILGHTNYDAELTLRDNLDGLDWLIKQMKKEKGAENQRQELLSQPARYHSYQHLHLLLQHRVWYLTSKYPTMKILLKVF